MSIPGISGRKYSLTIVVLVLEVVEVLDNVDSFLDSKCLLCFVPMQLNIF